MEKKKDKKNKDKMESYMKYSGMAIQMVLYIGIGVLLGRWIDKALELEKQIFTGILPIVFLGGYMYKLYIDLTADN